MRTLMTLLAAGLVLASCERASTEHPAEAEAAAKTVKSFVTGSRLLKTGRAVPGRYIVVLDERALSRETPAREAPARGALVEQLAQQLSTLHGATLEHVYSQALLGFSATLTEEAALRLSNDPRVRYVEEDGEASLASTQDNAPWGLDRIDQRDWSSWSPGGDGKYVYSFTGSGVHAYIIDTGIRLSHAEFGGRAVHAFSAVEDGNGSNDCYGQDGHGTSVASLLGGATYGVAKGVTLHSVRVKGCVESFTWSQVIAGVDWVTAHHVKPAVATLSIVGEVMQSVDDAVAASINAGVFYALPAGNNWYRDACSFSPARLPAAITVGASNTYDERASASSFGPCVDLFAPGRELPAASNRSDTSTISANGTSMAAAYVAGVAALLLERHPQATPEQLAAELTSTATPDTLSNLEASSPNRLLYAPSCNGNGPNPPQVVLTTPSGSTLSGTVTLSATATDDERVTRVEFFLDGRSLGWDGTAPHELVWNSATVSSGPAVLTARAYDTNCGETLSAPVNVTLENPGSAAFNATWGVPACAAPSSRCDSMGLLVGRGLFGPEPHHPNTLGGSCADGTGNTADATLSLERLVVSRADGTAFAAGKQVTIRATTAGWDGYGELVELYTASDPSNPTWSHIATLTQRDSWIAPYTWTTSYLLPTSGWRVFRAVHRKAWPAASDAACSSEPDADHDDLVITVGDEPDATPPVVALTSPAQGATLEGNVDVTVEASDNFGVQRVELYDGATLVASDSQAPYSLRWATRTASNGAHTLTARAYDLAGNSATSAPVDVMLDNDFVPPSLSFLTPAEGAAVSQTISLSGLVNDDRGVVRVTIEVQGGCSGLACPIQILEFAPGTPFEHFQLDWNSRGIANGAVVLFAIAHDAAGNYSPRVRLNVVVDNDYEPPQTALTAPASGALLSGHVTLEASASDDRQLAGVSFYVDGDLLGTDTTAPYAHSWDTESVPNGSHTLHTVAADTAGNKTTSASVTVETSNAGSVHYDPVLKVPRCELVRPHCDSWQLLRGRATFGPEQNTPNTLDGCLDGKNGYSYSPKQSIERLRVSREDGTALAAGKRVRIEADVWVPSGNTSSLRFFFAADALQPSWTYLTAIKPAASGFQTLSAEYVLPAGGVQAVRAKFGEGGDNNNPCGEGPSQSSWVDRDDLVFAVGQEADTAPPAVALTAPASGGTVTGWVTLTADASDNFGVVAVDFLDGQTLIGTATRAPFSMSWNSRSVPNGSHTLTARARDAAGNVTASQPVTVTVDNDLTPPAVVITAPASGATLVSDTAVEISAFATDDRGVIKRVDFYRGSYWLLGSDTSAPFTYTWFVYASEPRSETLTAVAFDAAGNHVRSDPVVVTITPELTPPSVSLTAPGDGAALSGTVTISALADDASGIGRVEFLLDGVLLGTDTSAPYSYTWDTRTAASGGHALTARAVDRNGNAATAEVQVTVDNAGPAVTLTAPGSGAVVSGVVSLQADATDPSGVTRVDFLVDGVVIGSDTAAPFRMDWDSGSWMNGNHTLSARAHDALNHQTTSAQVTVTTNQPGSAVYDSVLRVPKCATRNNVCDTTGLVRGRSGSEPNYSNTIKGTCSDGTASYTDATREKIDRLKLSSVDGGTFAQGQHVRLEVHVTVFDPATDALDLFSASDANNPSWTYLTTLRPGASGAQVLSTEYVLPAGFLQAVRAQWRSGGDSSSACASGSYDDRDDLVFAVDGDPVVTLTAPSHQARVRGLVSLAATAADDEAVTRVEFYDGQTLLGTDTSAPYALSWDSASVADGAHSLTARAYDAGGRSGTSAVMVTVDNTPPDAALTSPAPGTYLRGTAVLEATANDATGVVKVEFYSGAALLGTDTTAPYSMAWSTTSMTPGAYVLTVKAHDSLGNVRTSAGVQVTVDNTAPAAVAISAPASNALVGGTVQVSATASDSVGVAKVELYVDGTLLGTDTSAPYSVSWDSSGVADGSHSLTAKAYDHAGNMRTSTAVVVRTDNHLPDAALTAPTQGMFLRGTAVLEATASDAGGVTKVEFYDGATLLGTDTTAPYAVTWNTAGVADGAHTLTVKAHDIAGNVRTSAGVTVTVDRTAPTTAISAPAQNASVRGTVPVSATASDAYGVERVEFYADGALLGTSTTAPYVVSWDTTAGVNGTVTLTTRAYDIAGNVTTSANLVVTVDNSAPTVAITSPANGATFGFLTFSTTIQANASDNRGVTQVVFYDGASVIGTDTTAPYSVTWNVGNAPNGTHTLTAKAYDAAGNVTTSAPVSVTVN